MIFFLLCTSVATVDNNGTKAPALLSQSYWNDVGSFCLTLASLDSSKEKNIVYSVLRALKRTIFSIGFQSNFSYMYTITGSKFTYGNASRSTLDQFAH